MKGTLKCSFAVVCMIVCALFLISGCGKDEKKVIAKSRDGKTTVTTNQAGETKVVQMETKEGKVTVTAGSQTVTEAELGVPIYPGAKVLSSGRMDSSKEGSEKSYSQFHLTTGDDFDKVYTFYKSNLKNVDQTLNQSSGDQKMAMFSIGAKEKGSINVHIIRDDKKGETLIQVIRLGGKS